MPSWRFYESAARLRGMTRTAPGKAEGWPGSSVIVDQATTALARWAGGVPIIGGKPTDREAEEWVPGLTVSGWVGRVEWILHPLAVDIVWSPDPWTEADAAVLFTAVVLALANRCTAATCCFAERSLPRSDVWQCPQCGHERFNAKRCTCSQCTYKKWRDHK